MSNLFAFRTQAGNEPSGVSPSPGSAKTQGGASSYGSPTGGNGVASGSEPGIAENEIEKIDKKIAVRRALKIVIALAVVAIIGYFAIKLTQPNAAKGPAATTTAVYGSLSEVSACTTISKPGTYYLTKSISTDIQNGPCIDITSSNVRLIGNGNGIHGNGPYVSTPPYSYGILVGKVSNVTVTGVDVSKFSYDIYMDGSSFSYLTNSSARNATISGIFLNRSADNYLYHDNASGASSSVGGINLQESDNTTVIGVIAQNNAYYGIVVNSSGNKFAGDSFISNPVDLYCVGNSGIRSSSAFSSSSCIINQYCSFARCSTVNQQYNISKTVLQPGTINACGVLGSPGSYYLGRSLNVLDYVNASASNPLEAACLIIGSPNVKLDCKGNSVYNAGYGIYSNKTGGLYNVTIQNCVLKNDSYGVGLEHIFNLNMTNINANNGQVGIFLQNVTTGALSNINATSNNYGLILNSASGITFNGVNAKGNGYGAAIGNTGSNIYVNDAFVNNSKKDLSCSIASYVSGTQTIQRTSCGSTSCRWAAATCASYVPPYQNVRPISSCFTFISPGNYSVSSNIISNGGTCFLFNSGGVNLNCRGHAIYGVGGTTAFEDSGFSGISISNCSIYSAGVGILIKDANSIALHNISLNGTVSPLNISSSAKDVIFGINSTYSNGHGFNFVNVTNSIIENSTSEYGLGAGSPGFAFFGASKDSITFDSAIGNKGYGFSFINSTDNLVSNNTGGGNLPDDFYCSPSSSSVYANSGGINRGLDKVGCKWLVALPTSTLTSQCAALDSASYISLSTDEVYTYGAGGNSCYTIFNSLNESAGNTQINCNGHTIYASNGGTFAKVINASHVVIENCVLVNFTDPIISKAPYTKIVNDTFAAANTAITFIGSQSQMALNDTIINASYGVFVQGTSFDTVNGSRFDNVGVGIYLVGDSQSTIYGNNATGGVGLYMVGSSLDQVGHNRLVGKTSGISCTMGARNSTSLNKDIGGNYCSSNSGCTWMTLSAGCST
ncbi:MAG: NosD domain-containing protein [Candidatus Micrarchaeaceae archaeon]